jgi:hypothetical protein
MVDTPQVLLKTIRKLKAQCGQLRKENKLLRATVKEYSVALEKEQHITVGNF